MKHFWQRWLREWLPLLAAQQKWKREEKDFQVGNTVLVSGLQNTPRIKWQMGRIIEVFPGEDKHIRVARIQVGDRTLVRPIWKLCRFLDD